MKYGGYYTMKLTEKDFKSMDDLEASSDCPDLSGFIAGCLNTKHKVSFSQGKDGVKCVVTHETDIREDGLQTYMSGESDTFETLAILMHYKLFVRLKGRLPVHDAPAGSLGKWGR